MLTSYHCLFRELRAVVYLSVNFPIPAQRITLHRYCLFIEYATSAGHYKNMYEQIMMSK